MLQEFFPTPAGSTLLIESWYKLSAEIRVKPGYVLMQGR
jgi:hypothetical protein